MIYGTVKKLKKYRIRGTVLQWVRSFLSGRQQCVKLGNVCKQSLDITYGVPQGSELGPKLFIMYVNDICKISGVMNFVLFADDTNLFLVGDALE